MQRWLVAMLTGHPGPTFTLFSRMKEAGTDETWEALRATLSAERPAKAPDSTEDDRSAQDVNGNGPDGEDWWEFLDAMDKAHAEIRERGIAFDPLVRELRAWVPKVARYSFRSGAAMREGA